VYLIESQESIETQFTICKYLYTCISSGGLNKSIKYADEMIDGIIHSTQYYIKYTSRAILANLQHRSFELGRPIVLQVAHLWLSDCVYIHVCVRETMTMMIIMPCLFQGLARNRIRKQKCPCLSHNVSVNSSSAHPPYPLPPPSPGQP